MHDKFVDNFEKQVGVKHYSSTKYFDKYLQRKYGKPRADELFDAIEQRAQGNLIDIYPILNESLDFSIDCLSLRADLYKNYLISFSKQDIRPSKVLDIACGNGYLTCFYARKFPDCEVIGIDNSEQAVDCANELASKLDLKNVRFTVFDVVETELTSLNEQFDLVTAVTAFHEIIGFPNLDTAQPTRRLLLDIRESVKIDSLNPLSKVLRPETGIFISLEMLRNLRGFAWWSFALQNAGLSINFQESWAFAFKTLISDKAERLPVLWCQRKSAEIQQNFDDIIACWLFSKYREDLSKIKPVVFQGDLAEAVFSSVNPKIFLRGIKAVFDKSHTYRMEVWQSGPFILVFQFKPHGEHILEILPSIFLDEATTHLDDLAKPMQQEADVSSYEAPEVSWNVEFP